MKVYLVKIAVLLTVMSFIFCTEVFDSSAASEESGSTEFPKQPVFCNASLEDQEKIFNCIQNQTNVPSENARKLSNYSWLFCENITNFVTIVCEKANDVLVNMTDEETGTLFNLVLKCETELGVTLPPTSTPPAC
uniref:Putative secreted salivary gland peptide n=1 Tax=Ixodes ricinus TaxID=34613 RepID=A0A147BXL3_IXORI